MERLLRNMNDTQRSEDVCTVQQRIAELARERPHECFTAICTRCWTAGIPTRSSLRLRGLFARRQLDVVDLQTRVVVDRQGVHVGQFQSLRRSGQVRVKRAEVCQGKFHLPRLARRTE